MNSNLSMFPLGTAFLPGDIVALRVFESRYVAMVRDLLASDVEPLCFGTVLIERGREVGGDDTRRSFGVFVEVDDLSVTPEGGFSVIGHATSVLHVEEWLSDDPYPRAHVSELALRDESRDDRLASRVATLAQRVRSLLAEYLELEGIADAAEPSPQLARVAAGQWVLDAGTEEVNLAAWTVARHIPVGPEDRYALLSCGSVGERLQRITETVAHAAEIVAFRRGSRS